MHTKAIVHSHYELVVCTYLEPKITISAAKNPYHLSAYAVVYAVV